MQPLRIRIPRLQYGTGSRSDHIGVAAVVCLTAAMLALTCGIVYLRPPGQHRIVFAITDAASVKPGNEVRVVGVPVGKIIAVRLARDSALVDMSIDSDVFVGDLSTVEIRMLTAAGGYYVSLASSGSKPIGNAEIPASRTTPPYRLPDLVADAADKLHQVDGTQLGATLDRLAGGLEANPGAVTTIVDGARAIAQIIDHQQVQLRSLFDVSSEFMDAATTNQPLVLGILREAAILLTTLDTFKEGISQNFEGLAKVLKASMVASDFYASHRDWVIDAMLRVDNALKLINTDIPRIVGNLGKFVDELRNMISPGDKKDLPLLASDICVPVEGRPC